jgi:hypothetical protein
VAISKLFFFPFWKCGDLVFFWKFSKMLTSPCMFSWGTFKRIFVTQKKKKKKKKKQAALRLCVCVSWFKETGGLHSVRRSRVPTSSSIISTKQFENDEELDSIISGSLQYCSIMRTRRRKKKEEVLGGDAYLCLLDKLFAIKSTVREICYTIVQVQTNEDDELYLKIY